MKRKHFQTVTVEKEVASRKLTRIVTNRFLADFKKHGIATIERVRQDNPVEYLRIVTKLVPKQVDVGVQHSFSDVLLAAAEQIQQERTIEGELSDCSVTENPGQALIVSEGAGYRSGGGG